MPGIVSYGVYLPYWRLDRAQIAATLGSPAGRGTRAVASYDEDPTTMAVEAARACLASVPDARARIGQVLFATSEPPYLDKTNATAIHAALGLDRGAMAFDAAGSVNSANGVFVAAANAPVPTLAVFADVRTGMPGGGDEASGGDGAAAFLYDPAGDGLLETLGWGAATAEFLDRWREPGEHASKVWEERFGEHAYVPLAEEAVAAALKAAGVTPDQIDHLVVTGLHSRAARAVSRARGTRPDALVDDLGGAIGNTGAAHAGIVLASLLDVAEPGKLILRVTLADGAMAVVTRTTDALVVFRSRQRERDRVAAQLASGRSDLSYATFLTWRGELRREPPRRPDPVAPAAPPSFRYEAWKFGFNAASCARCGTRHLPPAPVCMNCGAVEEMQDERLAETPATVATFTVDRLAFTPNPPLVAAVVDFDGGGRYRCEVTDVDPAAIAIGDRVEMTFRRISIANGIRNYFWKARPIRGEA
jgi:3-hydroxy-3-methylglutaryl CoA synthase/uncharacterized OB-fold protein